MTYSWLFGEETGKRSLAVCSKWALLRRTSKDIIEIDGFELTWLWVNFHSIRWDRLEIARLLQVNLEIALRYPVFFAVVEKHLDVMIGGLTIKLGMTAIPWQNIVLVISSQNSSLESVSHGRPWYWWDSNNSHQQLTLFGPKIMVYLLSLAA